MNNNLTLKEKALSWLSSNAGIELLGPFELEEFTNDEEVKTTYKIKLKGTPSEFLEGYHSISVSPAINIHEATITSKVLNDGKQIDIYFETIDEYFIGAYTYLNLDIDKEKYEKACALANYTNTKSNLAFTHVIKEKKLSVKIKSFSCIINGVSEEDFYNVIYSTLKSSFSNLHLFSILKDSNQTDSEIITFFEKSN